MNKQLSILSAALLAVSMISAGQATAAAFTQGNVVVYRVGAVGGSLTSSAAASVFLDEFTTTGTLVQSIAMPTADNGANQMLTASSTATSEGFLTRSADGKYLALTGYDAAVGTTGIASTTSAAVNRTVGVVDWLGNVNTSTALNTFTGNNVRSVASTNGTDLWVSGATGIVKTTLGSTGTSFASLSGSNIRDVAIFDGQLYNSSGSGTVPKIGTVGTGLPITGSQTITLLPGFSGSTSPYAFFMADLDAGVAGLDTLYVADDGSVALRKFSLVSGNWTSNGTVGTDNDYRGLTGYLTNDGKVQLFATRKGGSTPTGGGELVSLLDGSGYNGAFSGTPTLLATASSSTAFRGVALAPTAPIPEADTYAFMALGMGLVGLLARRRKV